MESRKARLDGASSSSYSGYDAPRLQDSFRSSVVESQTSQGGIQKVSDSLYRLYEPTPAKDARVDVFFFHGLECEWQDSGIQDPHISTWKSSGEEEEVWPQRWLPEDFPQARIFSVSYDCSTKRTDTEGRMDLHLIGENVLQEFKWAREEHGGSRPVILVGHGFGGIVIKQLCVHAQNNKGNLVGGRSREMFLESIRGFCFYATPHLGIKGIESRSENEGPLLSWMRALNSDSARLHQAFLDLWRESGYCWTIFGLGEPGSTPGREGFHVPEGSSRFGEYLTVSPGHFLVCRPHDKSSSNYQHLKNLIAGVCSRSELEGRRSLMVPKITVGLDVLLTEILGEHLRDHKFVGISGMGGVGKTTLAKLIFNKVCAKFEYTCFVEDLKNISGQKDEVKKKIWEKMFHGGVPARSANGSSDNEWHRVTGKSLLIVFDDINDHDHLQLVQEIAHDNEMGESRFVLTSRDTHRLHDDDVYMVQLNCLGNRDAKELFTAYAFGGKEVPEAFKVVLQKVVDGCGGLPLTLEVLGKYLRGRTIEKWLEIPEALRTCDTEIADLDKRLWRKLELSYNDLGQKVKDMFLDIASFFVLTSHVFTADDAIMAWSSSDGGVQNRLDILVGRSLVEVREEKDRLGCERKKFYMHEHVRRMGQAMARRMGRSPDLSRQGSTEDHNYYPYDEKVDLQVGQELGDVIAHRIRIGRVPRGWTGPCPFYMISELLPKLTAIKYMDLSLHMITDSTTYSRVVLTLPRTSVLLRLSFSSNDSDLTVPVEAGGTSDNCKGRIVSLATCVSLVKLELLWWKEIGELSQLQQLRILRVSFCSGYGNWWKSLGNLRRLVRLELSNISEQFELPVNIGNLTELQYVSITGCKVASIPVSFRDLTSLRFLEVDRIVGSYKQAIPSLIRSFRELRFLTMHCWAMNDLVNNLQEVTALESLHLRCYDISKLPRPGTLGNFTRLRDLSLTCPKEKRSLIEVEDRQDEVLPDSFGNLTCLEQLDLECIPIQSLPVSFSKLIKLRTLTLCCEHGATLVALSNLVNLESLEITVTGNDTMPDVFGAHRKLRRFRLVCRTLERDVLESFRNLTSLEVLGLHTHYGGRAVIVTNFLDVKSLEIRVKGQLDMLDFLWSHTNLLTRLKTLKLYCDEGIILIILAVVSKLSNLESLEITVECDAEQKLRRFSLKCSPVKNQLAECLQFLRLELEDGSVELEVWSPRWYPKEVSLRVKGNPDVVDVLENLEEFLTRFQTLVLYCKHGIDPAVVRRMSNLASLEIKVHGHDTRCPICCKYRV
ncbi:hypothetical protein R1sor_020752 [Riccia sorocarpa]|uniref:NB-ARC domain-containing protein n=1 Tax=Riccia sorocarpa TaxID=122646 RepID=A0ABD3GGJ5_9MARC